MAFISFSAASRKQRPGPGPEPGPGRHARAETMTETKTHVILLSCGSFNPITRGHVHMFGEEGGGVGPGGSGLAACSRLSCHVFQPNLNRFRFGVKCRTGRPEKRVSLHQLTVQRERALPRKHAQSHSNGCIPSSPDKRTSKITVITREAVS